MEKIDKKVIKVFECISDFSDKNGYAPTVREISALVNIPSTATVSAYIDKLIDKGLLRKSPNKNRTLEIIRGENANVHSSLLTIPLVGKITAGTPIEAVQNIDDYYSFPTGLFARGDLIMLTVSGDSMIGAGIEDGDKIVIKRQPVAENGQIVAAMIDGEATVKRFYKGADNYILRAENKAYPDILSKDIEIIGILVGLIRAY